MHYCTEWRSEVGFKKRLIVAFLIILAVPVLLLVAFGIMIFKVRDDNVIAEEALSYIRDLPEGGSFMAIPMVTLIVCTSVTILLTAGTLLIWLYRSFIRPLNLLTLATRKMQEGNLDFSISGDPDDELGALCEDFEELRLHLKEETEARLQYERDVIELISNISHDLKTPLTAIKGYAEGLLDRVPGTPEQQDKYLRTIYTKASDMQVLVDELSFYSKIDSNIVPYNFEKLNVNGYFEDCVEDYAIDMEVKGIELTYVPLEDDGVCVIADAEQLRRVVNNVIGNSVKYMDTAGGRITIMARQIGNLVEVSIRDNGVGIAPEDLEMIFERFYRGDRSRNSRKGGSGLGLAISKKIIEDHGGTIRAESELGVHTTIIFTIPLCRGDITYIDEIEDASYLKVPGVISRAIDSSRRRLNAVIEREGRDRRGYLRKKAQDGVKLKQDDIEIKE